MLSFGNIILIILVFLVLFGAKRIPEFMANLAIGIKSFKRAMDSDDSELPLLKASKKDKRSVRISNKSIKNNQKVKSKKNKPSDE